MMSVLPLRAALAFGLALAGLSSAQAGVNPRNGNFFVSYYLSGEASPTITYNSRSQDRGWYGYGWGSLFETRLIVMSDGSAVVLEYGTGRQTAYGRKSGASPAQQLVQQILEDVLSVDKLDPGEVEDLRRKLSDSETRAANDTRMSYIKAYGLSRSMPAGTVLKGEGCDQALLRKQASTYERRDCSGNLDVFNEQGWLLSRTNGQGQMTRAEYGRSPFPTAWIEPDGTRVALQWSERAQVTRQTRTTKEGHEQSVQLQYDARGNLILLDYSSGLNYRFAYDAKHNLTEIHTLDNQTMRIVYDAQDGAISVTERDGEQTRYEYTTDPRTGDDSTVIVSVGKDGTEKRRSLRYAPDGLPLRTEDAQGRWTEYRYHPQLRKVTHMRSATSERRFEYDPKGNVIFAVDETSKRSARFTYDDQGRIIRLLSQDGEGERKDLSFRYNEQGKPIEIRLQGIGHIDVRYRPDGEIEAVNSPQGARTALAVTQAFQSMLSIVRMSGASLGF